MRKIVVCGAGGCGREVINMLEGMNSGSRWEIVGFADARASKGLTVYGYPVMSEDEFLGYGEPIDAVIAVGLPASREKIYNKFSKNPNIRFPAIISPDSRVARDVELREGVLIGGFCSVSPDAVLGRGIFLNGYCIVSHDVKIGDFSAMMAFSLLAGNVIMGDGVLAGAGSIVVQGITIGDGAELCAGSVVVRDVKAHSKMMGNPARAIA
jgi:sugar O-acyltransferase (sialic acid O-acetyltransferase NeuD family)